MNDIKDIMKEKILAQIIVERDEIIETLSNDIVKLCTSNGQLNQDVIRLKNENLSLINQKSKEVQKNG